MRAKMWHCWCYLWVCLWMHQGVFWWGVYSLLLHSVSKIVVTLWWLNLILYAWPTAVPKMVINTAIDILSLLAWISPPWSLILSLPPSSSPSSASLPFIYQIASTRSQLSPDGGSFLGWISVKWTHGIGRQSMTLSRDEREWEWWAPQA